MSAHPFGDFENGRSRVRPQRQVQATVTDPRIDVGYGVSNQQQFHCYNPQIGEGRLADPEKFAHIRQELGLDPTTKIPPGVGSEPNSDG
jgi:hypothetical protein